MSNSSSTSIFQHLEHPVNNCLFSVKWVPSSVKFIAAGHNLRTGQGVLQVMQMEQSQISTLDTAYFPSLIKCGTFKASPVVVRHYAFGCYDGVVRMIDLLNPSKEIFTANGHSKIINAIDGIGGMGIGAGAPELVTGGGDGLVNVWDPRQPNKPVVKIIPNTGSHVPDCWCVAFGDAHTINDRTVAAGFDNGDVKIFDLRTSGVLYETNVRNGVCDLEFDRPDIRMNKLLACTLEANIHAWDMRVYNIHSKYSSTNVTGHNSTVWCIKTLPQNREICMTTAGNGTMNLWKYQYPAKRSITTRNGVEGVPGTLDCITTLKVCDQPIIDFDWHKDKAGIALCYSLDQKIRTIFVPGLHKLN